jgi:hypothetical protein
VLLLSVRRLRRRAAFFVALTVLGAVVCPPLASAAEYRWIEPGGEVTLEVASAPRPTRLVGPRALAALADARAGRVAEPVVAAADFAAPLTARLPLAPPGAKPVPATPLLAEDGERVAALRARRRFLVGDEWTRVRHLRLGVRYLDALVVRLNGVELARRNLAVDAPPLGLAQRQRGNGWESVHITPPAGLIKKGENLLEIEVRPHGRRSVPTLDVQLVGSDRALLVRGPLVQRLEASAATIVVEAAAPTSAELRWGIRAEQLDQRVSSPRGLRHEFNLRGLPAGAPVHYQIVTPDEVSPRHRFFTPPRAGEPIRFVVYGDVRNGHDAHARVIAAVLAEAPDFVVTTGDMVERGTDEADWQRFFALAGRLLASVAVFPAIGNHDTGSAAGERRFEDIFALPPPPAGRAEHAAYYSFDLADVHVVVLDSNRWDDLGQLAWLEQDLAAAADARAIFAVCHHGPWSAGPHGGSDVARTRYVPLLARAGVSVLFSGHDHFYQRGRVSGLDYVVSGGGGASLYRPRCGVPGKRRCPVDDGRLALAVEYHYVLVEVRDRTVRLCPRRPDGSAIEACVDLPLGPRSADR